MIIRALKPHGSAVSKLVVEEYEHISHMFDVDSSAEPLGGMDWEPEPIRKDADYITFSAFIDGVQRTTQIYWVRLEELGVQIPIHVGHICVGIVRRDSQGKLHIDQNMIVDRLLLCMPLAGMKEYGFEFEERINELIDLGIIIEDIAITKNPFDAFCINDRYGKVILCDTTFTGIEEDDRKKQWENYQKGDKVKGLLVQKELYNASRIRSRAYGRVNTLRQILEMVMLVKFKQMIMESEDINDIYILVDGPLIFVSKWFRKSLKLGHLSDTEKERVILKNAVGIVKTLRARPKNIEDLKKILNLKEGERTRLFKIKDVVDVAGEEGRIMSFIEPHVATFLRLRIPYEGLILPSPIGLIRVDLHISTLGFDTLDDLESCQRMEMEELNRKLNPIINGIIREKWPLVIDKGRKFSEVYPIKETENVLKARLYSTKELGYISTLIRG